MSEIRDAILAEMQNRNMTIYAVAKLVKGIVPQRTVYAFLTGEKDCSTKAACLIMKVMGLKVTTTKKGKRRPERRPK
jgi:plasmid maintenance system antidote protein VapI